MKNISLLLFTYLFCHITLAQDIDIILKTSGEELPAKVTEITLTDVVYKKPDSLEGKTYTIPKKEVFMVKFANGSKEVISQDANLETPVANETPEAMYARGRADARKYYKGDKVLWGSAASMVSVGLLGPLIIGATPPKLKNQDVPDMNLLQDFNYARGYKDQAHSRKIGNAAAGAGIGTGVMLTVIAIALSTLVY